MYKNLRGYAPYNVKRLVMWVYDEDKDTYSTTPISLEGTAMSYKDDLSSSSTELYGDGALIDIAIVKNKGTLELGVSLDLRGEKRESVFGEVFKNNVNITTSNDVIPVVAVALMTTTSTGKVNLRKWFRAIFNPNNEEVKQIESSGTFSTATITGTYFPDDKGRMRARIDHLDAVTDKEIIEKWFTEAEYLSDTTAQEENSGTE